jgi:MATE family multidrug resistance protein
MQSVAGVAFGIMRGSNRSPTAALMTGIAYWVVGLPIAMCLGFLTDLRLAGVWCGVTMGLIGTAALTSVYIWKIDYAAECRRALARAELGSSYQIRAAAAA